MINLRFPSIKPLGVLLLLLIGFPKTCPAVELRKPSSEREECLRSSKPTCEEHKVQNVEECKLNLFLLQETASSDDMNNS